MSTNKDNAPAVSAARALETTTTETAKELSHDGGILQEARTEPARNPAGVRTVELISGDKVKPQPIKWLWDGYLAAGKFHIVAGAPGTGKTTLALDLVATLTKGGHWPDGTDALAGDVIIWSGEDSIEDTLAPRLIAAGADMARVRFVRGVIDGGAWRSFDPAKDFAAL